MNPKTCTRRELLHKLGGGIAALGLADLLHAGRATHFPAKAKQVVFFFLKNIQVFIIHF